MICFPNRRIQPRTGYSRTLYSSVPTVAMGSNPLRPAIRLRKPGVPSSVVSGVTCFVNEGPQTPGTIARPPRSAITPCRPFRCGARARWRVRSPNQA
ncbi:hypothetical protein RSAG8_12381, partial [Rhizoctonia solani AG-8 WAC10335]